MWYPLFYFLCKNCNPPWKSSPPHFPSNPSLIEDLSSPSLYINLVGGSFLQAEKEEGGANYVLLEAESFGKVSIIGMLSLLENITKSSNHLTFVSVTYIMICFSNMDSYVTLTVFAKKKASDLGILRRR